MLRLTEEGNIQLTSYGRVIATLDFIVAQDLSAKQLVLWENFARLADYERSKGFYCKINQRKSREIEISKERLDAYPLAVIQDLDSFNDYWNNERQKAIDR